MCSSLEVMHELGGFERILTPPHWNVMRIKVQFCNLPLAVADFAYLRTRGQNSCLHSTMRIHE